jgi:hypothetical protein
VQLRTTCCTAGASGLTDRHTRTPGQAHRLAKLVNGGSVSGIPLSASDFKSATGGPACTHCIQSKHATSPFPSSHSNSTAVLELVHLDVSVFPYRQLVGSLIYRAVRQGQRIPQSLAKGDSSYLLRCMSPMFALIPADVAMDANVKAVIGANIGDMHLRRYDESPSAKAL